MSDKELIGAFPFEIDVRVPIQLGRESISNSVVAFSELVKNSYDADAEQVLIKFQEMDSASPVIVIEDNGSGMSQDTLLQSWLLIGTRKKQSNKVSGEKKRAVTGEKGLGRLGIDRLCKKLILQTKTEKMDELLELHVEWAHYEGASHSLSDIKHELYRIKPESVYNDKFLFCGVKSSGTRAILEGLKDTWDEELIDALNSELSLLVSPFSGVNDFKIKIQQGENSQLLAESDAMLNAAHWVLDAELDENGLAKASMHSELYGETVEMKPALWADWIKNRADSSRCGPVKFKMYYIPQSMDILKSLSFAKKDYRDFMDRNQGVRIYRDHFRVKPYGDPTGKGDWLDLALRAVSSPGGIAQGGWRVGPNQVVGAVFISHSKNRGLEDQTNREGLLEGPAFYDLRAAVLKFIQFFEVEAHKFAKRRKPEDQKAELKAKVSDSTYRTKQILDEAARLKVAMEQMSSADERKQVVQDLGNKLDEASKALEETVQRTNDYEEILEQEYVALDDEKNTLANLASLGILTVAFSHEALEHCNLAATNAGWLQRNYNEGYFELLSGSKERFLSNIKTIQNSTTYIRNFSKFALGNVRPDKRKRKNVYLNDVIKKVCATLRQSLDEKNINADLADIPEKIAPIRAFEIDWESILINLITNSIRAMDGIVGKENRIIRIRLEEMDAHVKMYFSDSGCGIEAGSEEYIFDTNYSTRRDLRGRVIGTGMGLSIVKTFVEDHSDGEIKVISPSSLGGAEFQISVPRCDLRKGGWYE